MPPFSRPIADVLIGNYRRYSGGAPTATQLYSVIGQATAPVGDYIQSEINPVDDVYVTKLGAVPTPGSLTGYSLRIRASTNATRVSAYGKELDLVAELRQGYVDEVTRGALILSYTIVDVNPIEMRTYIRTITPLEAALITDHMELYIRVLATGRQT